MAFQNGAPREGRGDDRDVEMAAFTRTGVADVRGAVVANGKRLWRECRLERSAQAREPLGLHVYGRAHAARARFSIHGNCAAMNTKVRAVRPNTLKFTQAFSDALNATTILSTPSTA